MESMRFFILAMQMTLYFRLVISSLPFPGKGSFLLVTKHMFVRDWSMLSYLAEKIGRMGVRGKVRAAGEDEQRRKGGRRI